MARYEWFIKQFSTAISHVFTFRRKIQETSLSRDGVRQEHQPQIFINICSIPKVSRQQKFIYRGSKVSAIFKLPNGRSLFLPTTILTVTACRKCWSREKQYPSKQRAPTVILPLVRRQAKSSTVEDFVVGRWKSSRKTANERSWVQRTQGRRKLAKGAEIRVFTTENPKRATSAGGLYRLSLCRAHFRFFRYKRATFTPSFIMTFRLDA